MIAQGRPQWDYQKLVGSIHPFVKAFLEASSEDRVGLIGSMSQEGKVVLRHYAHGAAVLAVRKSDAALLVYSLTAVAILSHFDDFRDLLFYLSVLFHASLSIGADPKPLFLTAKGLATEDFGREIAEFPWRSPESRDIKAFGIEAVMTPLGVDYQTSEKWDAAEAEKILARERRLQAMLDRNKTTSFDDVRRRLERY